MTWVDDLDRYQALEGGAPELLGERAQRGLPPGDAKRSQPPPRRAAPTIRSNVNLPGRVDRVSVRVNVRRDTPAPATVSLEDVRRFGVIKARLVRALHTCDTLVLLREQVVDLVCDLSEAPAGAALDPAEEEHEAVTERMIAPPSDEQPPSIEVDSDVGREYGGG